MAKTPLEFRAGVNEMEDAKKTLVIMVNFS